MINDSIDPRWELLSNRTWTCSSCGEMHYGLFDLGCAKPDFWQGSEEHLPNAAVATSTNCLTDDFCILNDEHYFVRCILRLPLVGAAPGEYFAFGVWATLSKKNFATYVKTFDIGTFEGFGPWFGWFSNRLKGYPDTINLKCQVHSQVARQRPLIELEATDHPLAKDASAGIGFERLLEIYGVYGHGIAFGAGAS